MPTDPLSEALRYARNREQPLRFYLTGPGLAMDTHQVERTLRVIPPAGYSHGQEKRVIYWTEIGAEQAATYTAC
ncbi:MAG: transposase [Gammaproteobacteria bacterium]|nr:transposase [Gammaproteobacteria bacterium]